MALGDLWDSYRELYNRYREIHQGQPDLIEDISVSPEQAPALPDPTKLTQDPKSQEALAIRNVYESFFLASLKYLLDGFKNILSQEVFFTKNPNWIEPPLQAKIIDIFNPGPVQIAPSTTLELLKITVPKGAIAVINRFGNQAETGGEAWEKLAWNIKVDQLVLGSSAEWYYQSTANPPVTTRGEQYKDFHIQLGEIHNPTFFPMPFILREGQIFSVYVTNPDTVITYFANARVMGYLWVPVYASGNVYQKEMHRL
jgi:hypothetical protein